MRRPASFERYALLTSAALLLVLLPVRAADREDGKTGSGSGDSERSSERSCRPGQGSGSTSFSGSVRAPLFINKVWTRHGQIWFGDVLFGAIGHIEVPDGVSVDGKFSSRFWPIDVIQVVGSSIVFQSGRHRSGSIPDRPRCVAWPGRSAPGRHLSRGSNRHAHGASVSREQRGEHRGGGVPAEGLRGA
jgi:hypothetical protein